MHSTRSQAVGVGGFVPAEKGSMSSEVASWLSGGCSQWVMGPFGLGRAVATPVGKREKLH